MCLVAIGFFSLSCGPRRDPGLEDALIRPVGAIAMSKIVPGKWDRFCVITPYTPPDHAEQVTGISWRGFKERGDASNLLVFIREDDVVRSALVGRRVDFVIPGSTCFPAEDATFVARPQPDAPGFRLLLPADEYLESGQGDASPPPNRR